MKSYKHCVVLSLIACVSLIGFNKANATEVSLELSGVQGSSMAWVYTDPYQLKISNAGQVLTQPDQFSSIPTTPYAFCDDYRTDTYLNEVWQGHETNMSQLSGISSPLSTLKFDTSASAQKQQQDYMATAWLAEQIVAINQSTSAGRTQAGEMSFALWSIFDSGRYGAFNGLSWQERKAANHYDNLAYQSITGLSPNAFLNVNIYTPDPLTASQEFLVVGTSSSLSSSSGSPSPSVPAPKVWILFAIGLAILTIVSVSGRKRRHTG